MSQTVEDARAKLRSYADIYGPSIELESSLVIRREIRDMQRSIRIMETSRPQVTVPLPLLSRIVQYTAIAECLELIEASG